MDARSYVELKPNRNIPDFRPGDSVRVHATVVEGSRRRTQAFEGVVIRIRRKGPASSFTVRRVSHGVGVERVFPYYSPLVEKVEVMRVGQVRRATLYYLRERVGKAGRIKAGARSRFEELTAPPPEEEEEYEEEEAVAAAEVEGEEAASVEEQTPEAEATAGDAAGEPPPGAEDLAEEVTEAIEEAIEEAEQEAEPEPEEEGTKA